MVFEESRAPGGRPVQADRKAFEDLAKRRSGNAGDPFSTGEGDAELSSCETMQLSATVIGPDGNAMDYSWFTDDENIATIDQNGLVRGEVMGETNVGIEIPGVGKKWIKVTVEFG